MNLTSVYFYSSVIVYCMSTFTLFKMLFNGHLLLHCTTCVVCMPFYPRLLLSAPKAPLNHALLHLVTDFLFQEDYTYKMMLMALCCRHQCHRHLWNKPTEIFGKNIFGQVIFEAFFHSSILQGFPPSDTIDRPYGLTIG